MTAWTFKNKPFTVDDVGDYVGFIYIITEIASGKLYIGKKIFWNKKARPPLKGKKKRRLYKVPSDWLDYFGSNETLKNLVDTHGPLGYKREILHLCRSKSEMSYMETKELFARDALLDPNYFNDWVSVRVTRRQLGYTQ